MALAVTIVWLGFAAVWFVCKCINEDPGCIGTFFKVLGLLWLPSGLPAAILENSDLPISHPFMIFVCAWAIIGATAQVGLLIYVIVVSTVESTFEKKVASEKPPRDELCRMAWYFRKDIRGMEGHGVNWLKDEDYLVNEWRKQEAKRRVAEFWGKPFPPHGWNHEAVVALNLAKGDYSGEPAPEDIPGCADAVRRRFIRLAESEDPKAGTDKAVNDSLDIIIRERVRNYRERLKDSQHNEE